MKKHKVRRDKKLYYPTFTPFQKGYIKVQRAMSFLCALLGVIVLSPVFLLLCGWIIVDSGFPVFFIQKRVAKSKPDGTYTYFPIYKFRTMYTDTPKDMPTHMLKNPDAFITKAGGTPTHRQNKKSQPGGSKTHMLIGSRSWIDFVRRRRR